MEYFEIVDKRVYLKHRNLKYTKYEDLNINSLDILEASSNFLSPIAQYFIAPFIFYEIENELTINIALHDIDLHGDAMKQIICHFESLQIVTSKKIPIEARLNNLKAASKEAFLSLMNQKKINPFVLDFYHYYGRYVASGDFKEVKLNRTCVEPLSKDSVEPHQIKEFEEIWDFLKLMSHDKTYVSLSPKWLFSDNLINSICVQFFSFTCKEIYLSVDNPSSRVLGVYLYL
ncbi:hypothetical protein [Paenibacillus eucommiae]|uniref:Uncharacterized protein n=1 Tax=Paenibacillus eucommiae TaxID=1355755 RepID=A0ABS4IZK1_9BACL|nr:hypothetical protein [Paenibacillus eucommiae]MBP1993022.1 hypothetical protein [Paenibacillus eucommiae]